MTAEGSPDRADAPAPGLSIDAARLEESIRALATIGAYEDESTGLVGVRRVALTDEDAAGRRQVIEWMEAAGLRVAVDAIGNVFAERPGLDPSLAPVMVGSHIDSVPTGGAYDGVLGVLGGLEVVRTLDDRGVATRRPIVLAFFTDEEGCRFGTDMLGSAVATGRIPLDEAYALRDAAGTTVRDELSRIGFLGDEPIGARRPHAYLECHIEQGPVLGGAGHDVGVVTGVQAIAWYEVTFRGRSAHAGTTPTSYRRDAGLSAARVNVALRELVDSGRYGELRATMGVVRPHPGVVNVVPGRVTATIDLRNPDDGAMEAAERDVRALLAARGEEDGVEVTWRRTARTAMVPFDGAVMDRIDAAAAARGLRRTRLLSGAGHDAQEWARVAPAAMVFVPGEHDGISHNPREHSTREQCANGVNVLLDVVRRIADDGPLGRDGGEP